MSNAKLFADLGFWDMFPLACTLSAEGQYSEEEMETAICKVFDKSRQYPPLQNRRKWFEVVYPEKLAEARADMARRDIFGCLSAFHPLTRITFPVLAVEVGRGALQSGEPRAA